MSVALTAVVMVGPQRERAARALASLLDQSLDAPFEVIVIEWGEARAPLPRGDDPRVRTLHVPTSVPFGAARARAVRMARAAIVAFLEEHACAQAGWARALLAAYRPGIAAVGPTVTNANAGVGRGGINGVMSYGLFAPDGPRREVRVIPGNNSSYRRDVLLGYGEELDALLANDNALIAALRRDGHHMLFEPAARVDHRNEVAFGSSARAYFLYHRCYAPNRARIEAWSLARRLLYVVATPVIPIYFIVRFDRYLGRTGSPERGLLRRSLAYVYGAQLAAAVGQAIGLLLGPGDAELRFTAFELSEPRPLSGEEATPG